MARIAQLDNRRTLPDRAGYAVAALVIGLGLFASVTPSPLYRTYSALWHFSPLTLTLIYATYAFGVLATLLLAGRASDDVGRRPVLLVSLAVLMGSTVLFMLADSALWLFVARGVQGIATGAALSAASAALLDLHPRRDPTGVSLTNGVASAAGLGLGILVSSSLVQLGSRAARSAVRGPPRPVHGRLRRCLWMPEPIAERSRFRLTPAAPEHPGPRPPPIPDRRPGGSLVVVDRRALLLARPRALGATLRHVQRDHVRHRRPGSGGIGGGRPGAPRSHRSLDRCERRLGRSRRRRHPDRRRGRRRFEHLYLAGSIVGGLGFGAAFLGGLRALVAVIPSEHRAAVMSAFYLVAYASLSIPAVLAAWS